MTVIKYVAQFYELSRNATSILIIEYERAYFFVQGVRLPLCMSTLILVTSSRSFVVDFNHAQVMKEMYHEVQRGCDKTP